MRAAFCENKMSLQIVHMYAMAFTFDIVYIYINSGKVLILYIHVYALNLGYVCNIIPGMFLFPGSGPEVTQHFIIRIYTVSRYVNRSSLAYI